MVCRWVHRKNLSQLLWDKSIKDSLIKFNIRYVNRILVLAEVEDIDNMKKFNFFDKYIQCTIVRFEDGLVWL